MSPDLDPPRLSGPRARTFQFSFQPRTLGGRIVGALLAAVGLVVALAFSVVAFVFLAAAAVVGGGWLWWKTRHVREQLRAARANIRAGARPGEREVQGEVIAVRERTPEDR